MANEGSAAATTAPASALPPTVGNFGARMAAANAAPAAPPAPPAAQPVAMPTTAPAPANDNAAAPAQPTDPLAAEREAFAKQLEQPPANDNASATAADPWEEQIHGVTARQLLDAIKAGSVPAEALDHLKIRVNPNGNEIEVSLREAGKGYMRISDYTRGTQELAKVRGELEETKGKLRSLFDQWDKPEGFEQGLDRMGKLGMARAAVTKNWLANGQPNPQAFMADMRRFGTWDVFRAAVSEYAAHYGSLINQFGGKDNPHATALVGQWEANERAMWDARLKAEQTAEEVKREKWKLERQELLKQKQTQNPAIEQRIQQIHTAKVSGLRAMGLGQLAPEAQRAVDSAFVEAYRVIEGQRAKDGQLPDPVDVANDALQTALERLQDAGWRFSMATPGQRAPGQQSAPQAQQQPAPPPPTGMPTRPGAAPATSGSAIPSGGTLEDFKRRIVGLQAAAMRR